MEAAIDLLCGHDDKTEWGLTKGVLAGPVGNPKRVEGGEGMHKVKDADIAAAHEPHARRRGRPVIFWCPTSPPRPSSRLSRAKTLKLASEMNHRESKARAAQAWHELGKPCCVLLRFFLQRVTLARR